MQRFSLCFWFSNFFFFGNNGQKLVCVLYMGRALYTGKYGRGLSKGTTKCWERSLKESKQYLKSDFKVKCYNLLRAILYHKTIFMNVLCMAYQKIKLPHQNGENTRRIRRPVIHLQAIGGGYYIVESTQT